MNTAKMLSVNYGLYNAIRMLIGVYHAAFLISTGISISQLAILQIVFSATVLLLDFPLSVFADRYYRKQIVVIGVFFTIIFYPLCTLSPNFTALLFSEISYAIGICSISGAIEGWVLSSLDGKHDKFSLCAHLCERVSSFGSVITGTIGIFAVYFYGSYKAGYLISMVLMFIVLGIFLAAKSSKKNIRSSSKIEGNFVKQALESINVISTSRSGKYFILISCTFTLGVQVIYHFWQPIMLSDKNIGSISNKELIVLLMCHVGAFSSQYLANSYLPKFNVQSKMYSMLTVIFSILSSGLCIVLFLLITNRHDMLSVLAFSIIHGMISIIPVGAQNIFISQLKSDDEKYISGSLGIVSLSCRISSIIILGCISLLPRNIPVVDYIFISAVAYILCGFYFLKWSSSSKEVIYDSQSQ
ncbi:MFS transporter [Enterobacter pseudoroggenkampii]|uniref:MFS transporter n=1 Tax=Enterobacterales TaxID=91347 RepID=UPI000E0FABEC|nr:MULTISPECIES: MFS transporter [Enterobacter]NJQ21771.1 MFS transporter [Pantoea sp. LS15]NKF48367.1 MFS transporter [Pantoea sp. LS15]RDK12997.1 MFS transporter [Enterobacter sp. 9-2]WJW93999.1 MFS transporter [Enterobacter pseudoroggenkampii]